MLEKVTHGNALSVWLGRLAVLCLADFLGLNPQRSWIRRESICGRPDVRFWRGDFCAFGAPWKKPTKILTSCCLNNLQSALPGLQKSRRGYGPKSTKVTEPFPKRCASVLRRAIASHSASSNPLRERLDLAACAKVRNQVIGEANHPGPRPSPTGPCATYRGPGCCTARFCSGRSCKSTSGPISRIG